MENIALSCNTLCFLIRIAVKTTMLICEKNICTFSLVFKVLMELISHGSPVDLNGPGYQLAAEKHQVLRTWGISAAGPRVLSNINSAFSPWICTEVG